MTAIETLTHCDGWCHDEGTGDCAMCEQPDPSWWCHECQTAAFQDAEPTQ